MGICLLSLVSVGQSERVRGMVVVETGKRRGREEQDRGMCRFRGDDRQADMYLCAQELSCGLACAAITKILSICAVTVERYGSGETMDKPWWKKIKRSRRNVKGRTPGVSNNHKLPSPK